MIINKDIFNYKTSFEVKDGYRNSEDRNGLLKKEVD
jgi:hypothetical protein